MKNSKTSQATRFAQIGTSLVALAAMATLWLVAPTGCGLDFTDLYPPNNNDDNDVDTNGEPQDIPGPTVDIRFVNQTDQAVLADVFVSTNGALDTNVIFDPANKLIDGVGLASTGVLVPQSADSVEVPCEAGLIVATTGGVFRDPDSGDDLGTGPSRILQEGLVFDCGAEITFVYRIHNDDYDVVVTLN